MNLKEITTWIQLLATEKLKPTLAAFGTEPEELQGRDLVFLVPNDPRFETVALEYDPLDEERLLLVDVRFASPEAISHDQLTKRFGKEEDVHPAIDDFSGERRGSVFQFVEGEHAFCLTVAFGGAVEETVHATQVSLRRLVDAFPTKESPQGSRSPSAQLGTSETS